MSDASRPPEQAGEGLLSRWWRVGGVLVVVATCALGWLAFGPGADWVLHHVDGVKGLTADKRASALDAIRGRAITAATTLLAAVAIFFTARNAAAAQRTAHGIQKNAEAATRNAELSSQALQQTAEDQRLTRELTERGQTTDRFTAAVGQLGDPNLAIKLGGVHALASISDDAQPCDRPVSTSYAPISGFPRGRAPSSYRRSRPFSKRNVGPGPLSRISTSENGGSG